MHKAQKNASPSVLIKAAKIEKVKIKTEGVKSKKKLSDNAKDK